MGSHISEEPAGYGDEFLDAAGQAIGGHGVLHQAPEALDRVGVVGRVLRPPEHMHARIGRPLRSDHLGVVHLDVVHGQVERALGVGGGNPLEEGDEMDG